MKTERLMIVSDSHGNHLNEAAQRAALDFKSQFKPHHTIHLGDFLDLAALRNGASDEDKQTSMDPDIASGLATLDQFRPDVLLYGNHDDRLPKVAGQTRNVFMADLAGALWGNIEDSIDAMGIKTVPYGKRCGIYEYGDYRFMHGYTANLHTAFKMASHYGNSVMGHVHTSTGPVPFPHLDGAVGHTCGALCDIDLDYNKTQIGTLKQNNGWMYGFKIRERLTLMHVVGVGNQYFYPTEFGHGLEGNHGADQGRDERAGNGMEDRAGDRGGGGPVVRPVVPDDARQDGGGRELGGSAVCGQGIGEIAAAQIESLSSVRF